MSKNKFNLLLGKFVRIKFGDRVFYLPHIPANLYYKDNTLSIDMADMDEYVIVDGIRCYYCMIYHADNDTVDTWLKDFTIDGVICTQQAYCSFPLTEQEFPFGNRDSRMVVPKRDYAELTMAFLDEHKDLNGKVVKFLEKHPDCFEQMEQSEWLSLSKDFSDSDFDPDSLPETVSELCQLGDEEFWASFDEASFKKKKREK